MAGILEAVQQAIDRFSGGSAFSGGNAQMNKYYSQVGIGQVAQLRAQIQTAMDAKKRQLSALPGQYQPLKNESEVQRYSGLRNLNEIIANRGDRGGVGRQALMSSDLAGQNRLSSIGLQQQAATDDINADIANIGVQGAADLQSIVSGIEAERLKTLMSKSGGGGRKKDDGSYTDPTGRVWPGPNGYNDYLKYLASRNIEPARGDSTGKPGSQSDLDKMNSAMNPARSNYQPIQTAPKASPQYRNPYERY